MLTYACDHHPFHTCAHCTFSILFFPRDFHTVAKNLHNVEYVLVLAFSRKKFVGDYLGVLMVMNPQEFGPKLSPLMKIIIL